ncbi:DUF4174 domain-containing protein [Albibacillus kandeliae]|uniref:DUF4174 domain-containing protein n=1 Tax=Albibacillus kandeliae TaxID=2174228 RepID=UPI000D686F51|nr:DUF4174 domain-containing protein [Albibacillus kandeliae]
MTRILALVLAAFIPALTFAQDASSTEAAPLIRPAGDSDLPEFLWVARPVVVFADSPNDPSFIEQMELLESGQEMLAVRDVVVLTDTDPSARGPLRKKLRPRGFALVLIAKDGTVELRKPLPWTVRELTRSIDKMPDRQREVEERRGPGLMQ